MRRKRSFLFAVCLATFILFLYLPSGAVAQGPGNDPRCDGLTGVAYGMCAAAVAVGCGDLSLEKQGCAQIEKRFVEETGEDPPWIGTPCPCWSRSELVDMVAWLERNTEEYFTCEETPDPLSYFVEIIIYDDYMGKPIPVGFLSTSYSSAAYSFICKDFYSPEYLPFGYPFVMSKEESLDSDEYYACKALASQLCQ